MKIKGIVLSSILIINIINATPKDGVASPIMDGHKLLDMMRSPSEDVQFIANMYIWGVSVGLHHNYIVIDYLTDLNPEFQKRVKAKHNRLKKANIGGGNQNPGPPYDKKPNFSDIPYCITIALAN